MRHSFDSHLGDKDVNHVKVSDLMGRARSRYGDETRRRHQKTARFPQLKAVIEKIDHGIPLIETAKGWQIAKPGEQGPPAAE